MEAIEKREYSPDEIDLIKETVAKGATDLELKLFLYQAQRTGLDPLSRQIHFVKRWNKKLQREEGSIQTGIDGYRVIADRTGKYAGNDDYEFDDPDGQPKWAKATVYKMVGGQRCAFSATARWSQYYPGEGKGFMWDKMPHVMLGKCAEALALRKAFPDDITLYTHEEMMQAAKEEAVAQGIDLEGSQEKSDEVARQKIVALKARENHLLAESSRLANAAVVANLEAKGYRVNENLVAPATFEPKGVPGSKAVFTATVAPVPPDAGPFGPVNLPTVTGKLTGVKLINKAKGKYGLEILAGEMGTCKLITTDQSVISAAEAMIGMHVMVDYIEDKPYPTATSITGVVE